MDDLKPCPLCGGRAEIWRAHPDRPQRNAWIACVDGCLVLTKEYPTDAESITAWNTRAADRIEALSGKREEIARIIDQRAWWEADELAAGRLDGEIMFPTKWSLVKADRILALISPTESPNE